jgi:hypothetical protein
MMQNAAAQTEPGPFTLERADQLLAMTQRLCTLVDNEIQALKMRSLDGASADFEEKERLSHAWRLEVGRIKADPALLAGVDAGRKTALREASQRLESALEGHAHAVNAMKEVTEGIVRAIAGEVAAQRAAPAGYGRSGQAQQPGDRSASGLALDAKA